MYLGVAKKLTEAPIWPARFSHANPLEGMMTVAQAKVFNNKSWGLWTQDWRVQLAPVTGWQDWVQQLSRDIAIAPQVPSVDPDEVQTAYDYLSALDADMARMYLCH